MSIIIIKLGRYWAESNKIIPIAKRSQQQKTSSKVYNNSCLEPAIQLLTNRQWKGDILSSSSDEPIKVAEN